MAIIRRFDCILADQNAAIEKILSAASKLKGMTPEKLEELVKDDATPEAVKAMVEKYV